MSEQKLKRTSLFNEHVKSGGRLIDFGGWELPVQYSGVIDEHQTCRKVAGLFDVSHMGEIHVEGNDATAFLHWLLTNDIAAMNIGQAQYNILCNEDGGVVDDLVVYRRSPLNGERYLLVVNASNADKDFAWIKKMESRFKATGPSSFAVENKSADYSQIAIQGPKAAEIVQKLTPSKLSEVRTYHFTEGTIKGTKGDVPAILARTGYTGEDGFEIYVAWDRGPEVWQSLLAEGASLGLKPCGLGARDTLRMEMKYPLYGHELGDLTLPIECGLSWVVKLNKPDFIGKSALVRAKETGLRYTLIGLVLKDRGIPRQGYPVFDATGETRIGTLTSGTQSPSTGLAIGIASVQLGFHSVGTPLKVEIRGQKLTAEVVATPFYRPKKN